MLSNIGKKWRFWWLIAGVFLRLILMPITFHPDLWVFVSSGYIFASKGVFNIYDYIVNLPKDSIFILSIGNVYEYFIYPPLAYFVFGLFFLVIKPFISPEFVPHLWQNSALIFLDRNLFLNLFLFKLPYLFIDIATAFFLSDLFDKESHKRLAFILWMFNPLALYTTFMVGQFDLIPTFFVILALFFAKNKKFAMSILSLGIGGSFKMFPLLLIIPSAFIFGKNFSDKIKYVLAGFTPFILTIEEVLRIGPFLHSLRLLAFGD